NKTLLCADGYSYLLINSIMSPRINSPLALPPRIYCQVASVPFVLFGEEVGVIHQPANNS
ncbi:hypothetical protein PN450_22450, partial [Dolichospermum lemmermannii CS-548]|uniref:hypothetical protein n=1 Tax=Dolichospermum lemmermannii TaxID=54295 RepID=UPI00232F1DA6